ncbi:MAG: glycosyltransferase [Candidatus Omnitrophota bacterium]
MDISVIIPVYNSEKGLKGTLESLSKLTYPREGLEIVIVDNNSSDRTLEAAKSYQEKYPDLIKILTENEIQSSYAARNKGVKNSTGNIIVFLDADMTVEPDFLEKVEGFIKKHDSSYVGLDLEVRASKPENIFEKYSKYEFPVRDFIENRHYAPTACLAVKRDVFEKLGYFDERLMSGGDYEFGNRVFTSGIKLYFAPSVKIFHPARSSFVSLTKKYFRVGRGKARLHLYTPELRIIRTSPYPSYKIHSMVRDFISSVKEWKNMSLLEKAGFLFIYFSLAAIARIGYTIEYFKMRLSPGRT